MVDHIENYPLADPIVGFSITTEISNAMVHKVNVTLNSLIVLTPTALRYFSDNDLQHEALSKAGLPEDTTFTAQQQLSYNIVGGYHVYKLQFTVD